MDTRILLLGLAATAMTSCATAYRIGQTPDDVYYSPAKPEVEYVQQDQQREDRYNDYYTLDDYRLRMQVRNRNRYCACADDWYYDNWNTGTSWRYGWNNPWTWNSGYSNGWYYSYNPWCYSPYPSYVTSVNTTSFNYKPPIRNFGNSNTVPTTFNPKTGYSITRTDKPIRVYNNSNRSGGGFGGFLRQVLTPGNNSSGSSNNNRTYSPSSNNGGSRSSGSSSSGGSARPARNGKG
jgi:hypothetical protein